VATVCVGQEKPCMQEPEVTALAVGRDACQNLHWGDYFATWVTGDGLIRQLCCHFVVVCETDHLAVMRRRPIYQGHRSKQA